jgi:hypothetical protein
MRLAQRAGWQRSRSSNTVCLHKAYAQQAGRPRSLKQPVTASDFTLECLTVLRKGDVHELGGLIPTDQLAAEGTPVVVAGVPVLEHGPLTRCSTIMDAAARRVLPGHLLRRCRVLSSLSLGSSCVQRVALTACTGEELVLTWHLQKATWGSNELAAQQAIPWDPACSSSSSSNSALPGDGSSSSVDHVSGSWTGSDGSSSSSSGRVNDGYTMPNSSSSSGTPQNAEPSVAAAASGGERHQSHPSSAAGVPDNSGASSPGSWQQQWHVMRVHFDAADAAAGGVLPKQPHPRHPPETIVLAQLAALRFRDLHTAAGFNILGRHLTAGWAVQLAAFQKLLERPSCHLLLAHTDVRLASAACPLPRQFLVEVVLQDNTAGTSRRGRSGAAAGSGAGTSQQQQEGRFLWRMAMHADGCWLVKAIEAL